ncbi:MAG: GAF domain-containing sensor histidine kinase [Desulfomonilia bacterium]
MVTVEKIRELIDHSDKEKLLCFYTQRKKKIHQYLRGYLKEKLDHPYHKFLLNTQLGRKRVWIYMNSVEEALRGNVEAFFTDQEIIGYLRALEGYNVYDVLGFTVSFKKALWRVIREYNSNHRKKDSYLDIDDMTILHQVSDCSYYLLSRSFMETSKQIITRHSKQLQALQRYAAENVSIFEEEKIWAYATQGLYEIFDLYGTFLVANDSETDLPRLDNVHMIGLQVSRDLLNKLIKRIDPYFQTLAINSKDRVSRWEDAFKKDHYKIICKPIKNRNEKFLGLLFVHDQSRPFLFSEFDADLLQQFAYFTASVLTNCRMALELGYSQRELGELAGRLISIQEKERKKISADVHDTIAQALSGIGYKALLCQEIANRDLPGLNHELNRLTEDINKALKQSRQLIQMLRPPVLDEIGIIPALKNLINSFSKEVEMDIRYSLPREITINPDKGISLYRILQESLQNIKKHSSAKSVCVYLRINDKKEISLDVIDDGKGFDITRKKASKIHQGFGLLIMRERAKDMGGKIRIESRNGEGCKIHLTIPRLDDRDEYRYQSNSR